MDTQQHAERIASKVPESVGFDPITIITILTTVLPMIMTCFNKETQSASDIQAKVKEFHDSNPRKLRIRTARRVRAEAEESMTKEQSFVLADAIIKDSLESSNAEVTAYSNACEGL